MPRILSLAQASRMLKAHPETITEAIRSRKLPATKVGRAWVFVDDDLIGWVRTQYHQPESAGSTECGSTDAARVVSGGSTSARQAAVDLTAALAPRTKPRRRNGPPQLTAISGGSTV